MGEEGRGICVRCFHESMARVCICACGLMVVGTSGTVSQEEQKAAEILEAEENGEGKQARIGADYTGVSNGL